MICNLTLNPAEYYFSDEIMDFKKTEVAALYKEFWSDYIADYIVLAKDLADIAEESGAKRAVFDVPAHAVSTLETELLLRKILPIHYYSGQFVETKSEVLLENLYAILENHTSEEQEEQSEKVNFYEVVGESNLGYEEEFKEEECDEAININPGGNDNNDENSTIQSEPIEHIQEKTETDMGEKKIMIQTMRNAPGHSLNINIKQNFKY